MLLHFKIPLSWKDRKETVWIRVILTVSHWQPFLRLKKEALWADTVDEVESWVLTDIIKRPQPLITVNHCGQRNKFINFKFGKWRNLFCQLCLLNAYSNTPGIKINLLKSRIKFIKLSCECTRKTQCHIVFC